MEPFVLGAVLIACAATAFVFSNLGMGGGLLYVPVLLLVAGMSFTSARPVSLAFAFATTSLSAFNHARHGLLDLRVGALAVLGTLTGMVIGYAFIMSVPDRVPAMMFSALLFLISGKMALDLSRGGGGGDRPPLPGRSRHALIAGATLLAGFLSITLAIGGGVILVPLFIYAAGLETKRAAGTSSFTAMFTTLAGVVTLLSLGQELSMEWGPVLVLVGCVALGSFIGSRWGITALRSRTVNMMIIAVLMLSAVSITWKYL